MEEDGGVAVGDDGTCAHSAVGPLLENMLVVGGDHELLPIRSSGLTVSGGEAVMGLGEGDGALALMDRGCRMLKI